MSENKDKTLAESLSEVIEKYFGGTKKEAPPVERITKSVNDEQRVALFVVLEPQDEDYTLDAHGDTYTAEDIRKACMNFNQNSMKANLFHQVETEDAIIVESYIAPVDFTLDAQVVKAGTWLQSFYFPETEVGEVLWQAVKSGEINGVSIQCMCSTEEIE